MARAPVIIALDLGTSCGYAVLQGSRRLESGRWKTMPTKAKRVHRGERWAAFTAGVTQLLVRHPTVELIAYERVRRHLGTTAAHVYGGFIGTFESIMFARFLHGGTAVQEEGIEVPTWKMACGLPGNADKATIRAAMDKRFRIKTKSEDEADALGVAVAARVLFR